MATGAGARRAVRLQRLALPLCVLAFWSVLVTYLLSNLRPDDADRLRAAGQGAQPTPGDAFVAPPPGRTRVQRKEQQKKQQKREEDEEWPVGRPSWLPADINKPARKHAVLPGVQVIPPTVKDPIGVPTLITSPPGIRPIGRFGRRTVGRLNGTVVWPDPHATPASTHPHARLEYLPDPSQWRIQRDFDSDPVLVVSANNRVSFPISGVKQVAECPIPCAWTADESYSATADAIVFTIPGFSGSFPLRGHDDQQFVLFSQESEVNYPGLVRPSILYNIDLTMTYRLDSDVPVLYPSRREYQFQHPVRPKTAAAPAVAVISNCKTANGRLEYIRQLEAAGIAVDSYGKCLHTKDIPGRDAGFSTKVDLLRTYPFTLAFENSNAPYYVSEKYFQALVAGSVPVYIGASNVDELAPAPNAHIKAADFASPAELAEHLKWLLANPSEYDKLLAWKKSGGSAAFQNMLRLNDIHSTCRLCLRLVDPRYRNGPWPYSSD